MSSLRYITSSGVPLNDFSVVSPTVQSGLITIVIKFRIHPFVTTAHREAVSIDQTTSVSTNLQPTLRRENTKEQIKMYYLLKVAYGTSSASYLTTRTVKYLTVDEKQKFLTALEVIIDSFYVDYTTTGVRSFQEAKQLQ